MTLSVEHHDLPRRVSADDHDALPRSRRWRTCAAAADPCHRRADRGRRAQTAGDAPLRGDLRRGAAARATSGWARTTSAPGWSRPTTTTARPRPAIYVVSGNPVFVFLENDEERRIETRAAGDYVYVPPWVPHREENPSPDEEAVVVLARSTQEGIAVNLPSLQDPRARVATSTRRTRARAGSRSRSRPGRTAGGSLAAASCGRLLVEVDAGVELLHDASSVRPLLTSVDRLRRDPARPCRRPSSSASSVEL